ncbi:hypothetical protein CC78DRAFT_338728 [Lojkania enalia]|uniref:Uncharacterized protein n=1 Tax=Lojkania enalia TaxID=147567 RepID=A0A9P4K4A6_9PLEO|nr:hypothetical protein CC78DRAFT_338728 [Didymosphaeria enalia]
MARRFQRPVLLRIEAKWHARRPATPQIRSLSGGVRPGQIALRAMTNLTLPSLRGTCTPSAALKQPSDSEHPHPTTTIHLQKPPHEAHYTKSMRKTSHSTQFGCFSKNLKPSIQRRKPIPLPVHLLFPRGMASWLPERRPSSPWPLTPRIPTECSRR